MRNIIIKHREPPGGRVRKNWDSRPRQTCDHSYWDWASRSARPRSQSQGACGSGIFPEAPPTPTPSLCSVSLWDHWLKEQPCLPPTLPIHFYFFHSPANPLKYCWFLHHLSTTVQDKQGKKCGPVSLCFRAVPAKWSKCNIFFEWMNEKLSRKCMLARQIKNK